MLRLPCVFALALTLSLSNGLHAETPKQPVDLLNGKDLTAWELVTATTTDAAAVCRYEADGSLAIAGKPVGYLVTKASFENYQLHAEWRWPATAAKNSNSGVLLHITSGPANGTPWPRCFQAQLKPTRAGDLLPMNGAQFAETLSTPPDAKTPQLDRRTTDSERPLGEWNSCDILCRDGTIQITVNGVLQNTITRGAPAAGRIGFQLEGTPYDLRNVRIAPLR